MPKFFDNLKKKLYMQWDKAFVQKYTKRTKVKEDSMEE